MGAVNDYFVFNGVSSKEFGALVSGYDTFNTPERDESVVDVPGRNGSIVFDNGRWKNTPIAYKALIYKDFDRNYAALSNFFASISGYHRLEDTMEPDVFRIARRTGEIEQKMHGNYDASGFVIHFDCKPQKFFKSGEAAVEYTDDGSIYNPTQYTALPLIRVYSAGTLQIGSDTLIISNVDGYVDIDCDLQNAYKGAVNCNSNVSGSFPKLVAGENNIVLNTISKIDIIPRWWTL